MALASERLLVALASERLLVALASERLLVARPTCSIHAPCGAMQHNYAHLRVVRLCSRCGTTALTHALYDCAHSRDGMQLRSLERCGATTLTRAL